MHIDVDSGEVRHFLRMVPGSQHRVKRLMATTHFVLLSVGPAIHVFDSETLKCLGSLPLLSEFAAATDGHDLFVQAEPGPAMFRQYDLKKGIQRQLTLSAIRPSGSAGRTLTMALSMDKPRSAAAKMRLARRGISKSQINARLRMLVMTKDQHLLCGLSTGQFAAFSLGPTWHQKGETNVPASTDWELFGDGWIGATRHNPNKATQPYSMAHWSGKAMGRMTFSLPSRSGAKRVTGSGDDLRIYVCPADILMVYNGTGKRMFKEDLTPAKSTAVRGRYDIIDVSPQTQRIIIYDAMAQSVIWYGRRSLTAE